MLFLKSYLVHHDRGRELDGSMQLLNDRYQEASSGFVAVGIEELDETIPRHQAIEADTRPGSERVTINRPYSGRVVFDFEPGYNDTH